MLRLNLVFQFIFCFLTANIKHWFLRMFTEADIVSNNTGWVLFSVSVLLLFLVENCLKTLLLVHLHLCFDGKTPAGFRQTNCFEDVDSVLLNWGPIKLSLVLQCQGCVETPWHSWKSCDYGFFLPGFWIVFHSCLLPQSARAAQYLSTSSSEM